MRRFRILPTKCLCVLLVAGALLLGGRAQAQTSDALGVSLSLSQTTIRKGKNTRVQIRLRNPLRDTTITLQATATYTDASGVQRTVTSNTVTLTVDNSQPARLSFTGPGLQYIANSAKFDGVAVQPVSTNAIGFDVVVPGDGNEHLLEFDVTL